MNAMHHLFAAIAAFAIGLAPPSDEGASAVRVEGVSWHRLPDGRPALLVRFEVKPEWHMYWMNPGDSGAPPTAKADLPEGWRLGEPIWPRPRVQETDGETLFVHEGRWGWLLPVEGPTPRALPDFPIELKLRWMVCRLNCSVASAQVRVPVAVSEPSAPPEAVGGSAFPQTLGVDDHVSVEGGALRIDCGARGKVSARLVQATDPGVSIGERNPMPASVTEGRARLDAPLALKPQDALGKPLAVSGLLLLGDRPGDPCLWIRRSVPQSAPPQPVAP